MRESQAVGSNKVVCIAYQEILAPMVNMFALG